MSKLTELLGSQPKGEPVENAFKVDLSANCGVCYMDVDEADYYAAHKVLKFTCAAGHTSYLEDFTL